MPVALVILRGEDGLCLLCHSLLLCFGALLKGLHMWNKDDKEMGCNYQCSFNDANSNSTEL